MKLRIALAVMVWGLVSASGAAAAPGWVTPVANLTPPGGSPGQPQVASNARGDVAIAWVDPATGHVFESDRPAGGAFSPPAEISSASNQGLGSIAIDGSGLVYVFFGTDTMATAAMTARVATRPVGGSTWVVTPLAGASASDPPQVPIGAVTPSGAAMAVWLQAHTADNVFSKFVFSTKPAGSTTWSPKADVPGACGCGSATAIPSSPALALNPSGNAAFLFTRFNVGFVDRILWGQTFTAGSAAWTAPNAISAGGGSMEGQPVVAMDQIGTATAAWIRSNSANNIVQFATKTLAAPSWPAAPGGTTVTPGANDLSPLGSGAGQPAVAAEPDGTTTVAWARNGVVEERTRGAGGDSFALATAMPGTLVSPFSPFLATGPDGEIVALWSGMSSGQLVIGAASRAPSATVFSALPSVPGTENSQPAAAVDDQGNVAAAWVNNVAGQFRVQATGFDAGPPTISNVSFPETGVSGEQIAYGATATDRWSPVAASWAFGDGSTGPPSGTHTYVAPGSFLATLTATDAFGHSASASRTIQVGPSSRAPAITRFKLSPATFAAMSKGPSISKAAGTTVRYAISQPSTTTFTVQRRARGVRKGKRCVPSKPRARGKRKARPCQRFVDEGSFSHVDPAAGAVSFRFTGRVGGKALTAGRYRLRAVGKNAAGKGKAVTAPFRIVKRRVGRSHRAATG